MKKNTRERKFWENLGTHDISQLKFVRFKKGNSRCVCGQPISTIYVFHDKCVTIKEIGNCCLRRFGMKFRWSSKADYLVSAFLLCKNDWEKEFVRSLQNKLPKYGSGMIVSQKQKVILERIAMHKWRWSVWSGYQKMSG
jgi:hypothetical protein